MASRKLFYAFPPVTTDQWENKIQEDLKGADYDKKLVWKTPEGFKVQPYYRSEHTEEKVHLESLPGEFPYVRGNEAGPNDWEIRQEIRLDDIALANQKSLFILNRGITSLGIITPPYRDSSLLESAEDMELLFKDIHPDCIRISYVTGYNATHLLQLLSATVKARDLDNSCLQGTVDFDPLGYLTTTGNFSSGEKEDFRELADLIHFADTQLPGLKVLGIHGYFLHNAGSTVVQELAFSLAMASDYLSLLSEKGLSPDTIAKHMHFNLGVGSNYFMEIAKIRALRYLWAKLMEAWDPKEKESLKTEIHSITSEWNQTIYDPYVNVLRATTESMAAVIGGTDSLSVRPFTYAFKETSKFAGRLARNIQIILKEEAYLGNISDPSAGSYYIENLTDLIIDETWALFLQIEEAGGYLSALKKGLIKTQIDETTQLRKKNAAAGREVFLGTNQYANPQEKLSDDIDEDIAFPAPMPGEKLIAPLVKYRAAADFEKLRLATERHTTRPKVFLLTLGNLTMRKARAAFSANFFATAGYEILDNPGFDSVKEGVDAARKARADIVVVCSSDDEYAEIVPEIRNLLKDQAILVVAGAPPCMDELKETGVKHFIHLRSDILESLKEFHLELGIKTSL